MKDLQIDDNPIYQITSDYKKFLSNRIDPNPVLIYGRDDIDKKQIVLYIICLYFCKSNCDLKKCDICLEILSLNNKDIFLLDLDRSIKIEDILNLKDFLKYNSSSLNKRIAVINNSDKLTNQASNALLKILEEPFIDSKIFLISNNINYLPDTLLSRLFKLNIDKYYFDRDFISNDQMVDLIKNIIYNNKFIFKNDNYFDKIDLFEFIFNFEIVLNKFYKDKLINNFNINNLDINKLLEYRKWIREIKILIKKKVYIDKRILFNKLIL